MNQGSLPRTKTSRPQPSSPLRERVASVANRVRGSNRVFSQQPLMLPTALRNHENSLAGSKSLVFSIGLDDFQGGTKRQKGSPASSTQLLWTQQRRQMP